MALRRLCLIPNTVRGRIGFAAVRRSSLPRDGPLKPERLLDGAAAAGLVVERLAALATADEGDDRLELAERDALAGRGARRGRAGVARRNGSLRATLLRPLGGGLVLVGGVLARRHGNSFLDPARVMLGYLFADALQSKKLLASSSCTANHTTSKGCGACAGKGAGRFLVRCRWCCGNEKRCLHRTEAGAAKQ